VSADARLEAAALAALAPFVEALVERVVEQVHETLGQTSALPETTLLSVPEAAAYIRARSQRVYDLVSQRRLTPVRDGKRVLIEKAELDRHLGIATPHVATRLPRAAQRRTPKGSNR
jgi:excisionase family DNA binding protein